MSLQLLPAATCLLTVELLGMLDSYAKHVPVLGPILGPFIKPLTGFLDRVSFCLSSSRAAYLPYREAACAYLWPDDHRQSLQPTTEQCFAPAGPWQAWTPAITNFVQH